MSEDKDKNHIESTDNTEQDDQANNLLPEDQSNNEKGDKYNIDSNLKDDDKDSLFIALGFESGDEKETESMKQQRLGAYNHEVCKTLKDQIKSTYESFPESTRGKVENWMHQLQEKEEQMSYEERKNVLAFLSCKLFFDLDGVKNPAHLTKTIDRVKKERNYSQKIKDEVNLLLTHIPANIEKFKEIANRQKMASDFRVVTSDGKNNYSYAYYLSEFSKGNITSEEFKKFTDNRACREQKDALLMEAKKRYKWEPSSQYKGLSSYSIA